MTLGFGHEIRGPRVLLLLLLVASSWFHDTLSLPRGRHVWPSSDHAAALSAHPGEQGSSRPGEQGETAQGGGGGGTLIQGGSGGKTSGKTTLIRHRRQDPPPVPPVPPDPPIPVPPVPPVPPDPPTSTSSGGGGGGGGFFNPFAFANPFNAFGLFDGPSPRRFRGPYYARRSYYNPDPITSFFDQIYSIKSSILGFFF